jgi:hypothetical protein
MLDQLSVEEVKRVADLAARALAVRDRLVNKLYDVDLGDQPRERGDRNPTDLDSLRILDSVGNADYAALKDHIASLSTEQRDELKTVMLIGRGDYAAERWDDAIAAARAVPDGDVEYVAEKAPLHDYLMKGLYELKLG